MSSDDSFFSDDKGSDRGSESDHEEKPDVGGLGLKVVDIPTGSQGSRRDRSLSDSNSDYSDGESQLSTQRTRETPSPRRRRRKKRSTVTLKDGSVLDLTPPDELLPLCQKKARYYTSKKQTDNAIREWTRYTALCRLVYGNEHWKLAEGYVYLAHAYLTLRGLAPQAQAHSETARTIMLNGLHTSESDESKSQLMGTLLLMYYVLGRALTILKKYPEAEQNLVKAERVSQELSKMSSEKRSSRRMQLDIDIAIALAKLYAKQQKHALGAGFYEKAIRLTEEQYGSDSPELIPIYQDMGRLEQSKKDMANHDRATDHFLQAHSIAVSRFSGQSEEVAETAHALALAYSESATAEAETAAEQYLNESLGIRQVLFGPHHAKTISTQDDLCKLLIRTDRVDEAVSLLKTLITSKSATFGDLSAEVGEANKLYGSILMSQGQLERALKFFKKSHNIESNLYGPSHRKTKATQQTIDMLLQSPMLAAKEGQTRAGQLKSRPRFNATVGQSTPLGSTGKIAFE
ncbi:tetratricopeptide repeat protein 23-like [Diadema setosum]|uniref:tetratricopeptide repeat protein 23-like n=1 Tax=Diadema setosum TaxID=31175 RepID=UPI003B3A1FE6